MLSLGELFCPVSGCGYMCIWKEWLAIGKVEVVELRQEWQQYTIVPAWSGSPRDPVNNKEEEK